jgi:hypothetical protein
MRSQVGRDSEGTSGPAVSCLELELEGELDGAGTSDLVKRAETASEVQGKALARRFFPAQPGADKC